LPESAEGDARGERSPVQGTGGHDPHHPPASFDSGLFEARAVAQFFYLVPGGGGQEGMTNNSTGALGIPAGGGAGAFGGMAWSGSSAWGSGGRGGRAQAGQAGGGGGAGAGLYLEFLMPSPPASIAYAVGAGGTLGGASSGWTFAGIAGNAGAIIIEEHY